jgi:hypothetical protein
MIKKRRTERSDTVQASLKKELARPRMAKSARIAELELNPAARIGEHQPSTTLPGAVDKIIASPRPGRPEKAQIAVSGAKYPYRDLRIENALINEHGDEVKLRRGAHVDVTVTAKEDGRKT